MVMCFDYKVKLTQNDDPKFLTEWMDKSLFEISNIITLKKSISAKYFKNEIKIPNAKYVDCFRYEDISPKKHTHSLYIDDDGYLTCKLDKGKITLKTSQIVGDVVKIIENDKADYLYNKVEYPLIIKDYKLSLGLLNKDYFVTGAYYPFNVKFLDGKTASSFAKACHKHDYRLFDGNFGYLTTYGWDSIYTSALIYDSVAQWEILGFDGVWYPLYFPPEYYNTIIKRKSWLLCDYNLVMDIRDGTLRELPLLFDKNFLPVEEAKFPLSDTVYSPYFYTINNGFVYSIDYKFESLKLFNCNIGADIGMWNFYIKSIISISKEEDLTLWFFYNMETHELISYEFPGFFSTLSVTYGSILNYEEDDREVTFIAHWITSDSQKGIFRIDLSTMEVCEYFGFPIFTEDSFIFKSRVINGYILTSYDKNHNQTYIWKMVNFEITDPLYVTGKVSVIFSDFESKYGWLYLISDGKLFQIKDELIYKKNLDADFYVRGFKKSITLIKDKTIILIDPILNEQLTVELDFVKIAF